MRTTTSHYPLRTRCFPIAIAALIGLVPVALIACDTPVRGNGAAILLFTGAGTSASDISAVEIILDRDHLSYATANSPQLNRLTAAQLRTYRLVIVPGGNFMDMSANLTPQTTARIHDAVQQGVNYLGICAGAFLAGDGRGYYRSFNLASGARFGLYAAEAHGVRKAAVAITGVNADSIEHYWEDGPQLSGWGTVVGKYPDGTPAVVEGTSGQGWVMLAGIHPEAPETWRSGMTFTTPATAANAYAGTLVQAALTRTWLPHF